MKCSALKLILSAGAAFGIAALVGCGGGGAMPGPPGGGGDGPSPSPSPSPSPATVSGTVTNFDSGVPLAGATVKIGSLAPVLTNGSGEYTVSGIPGGSAIQYIQISDGASFATYNSGVAIAGGATTTRNVKLMDPSTDCAQCPAWLTQVNADRAANGAGPVAFDEHALEAARLHSPPKATDRTGIRAANSRGFVMPTSAGWASTKRTGARLQPGSNAKRSSWQRRTKIRQAAIT